MSYEVKNPENGVVIAKLIGELSIEEIQKLNQFIHDNYLADDCYIIYEVSELSKFPTNIPALQKASAPIASSKTVKMQIVSGVKSPVFNFLFEVVGQLFKQSLKKTNTLEDALRFVAELRAKA